MVYERRANACEELLRKLDKLRFDAEMIVYREPTRESLTPGEKAELTELRAQINELQRVVLRSPFLPSEVGKPLTDFIKIFNELCKPEGGSAFIEREPGMNLLASYIAVAKAIDKSLKVDLLEEELVKTLGPPRI